MEIAGLTLDLTGSLMIAYTAIMVHHRVWMEHKIDDKVFAAMRRERNIGVLGMFLVVLGYFLVLISKI